MDEPSIARIWDWFLGGSHNFAADREVARATLAAMPEAPRMAQLSRAFLRRAVRFCVTAGISQFLDIGSGIPTVGNVHEVAQAADPSCRVVYVDRDPVAVAHTRRILEGQDLSSVLQADLRRPRQLLDSPRLGRTLDFERPVAVLMVSVLHFVPDSDDPAAIVASFRERLAPGSALVIAHGSSDTADMPSEHLHTARRMYERAVAPVTLRSRTEVEAFFAGFELVEPGVVWLPRWRPEPGGDGQAVPKAGYGGVGFKR